MVQEERKRASGGRGVELVVYREGRRLKEVAVKGKLDSLLKQRQKRAARVKSKRFCFIYLFILTGNIKSA